MTRLPLLSVYALLSIALLGGNLISCGSSSDTSQSDLSADQTTTDTGVEPDSGTQDVTSDIEPSDGTAAETEQDVVDNQPLVHPSLEPAVRKALAKPNGPLECADLAALTSLVATDQGITDLTGLECAINLTELDVSRNRIVSIWPIAELTKLQILKLADNRIGDLGALEKLLKLETLDLSGNRLVGLSSLKPLVALKTLRLNRNLIQELLPLKPLTELTTLELADNRALNLTHIANLVKLESLDISRNAIVVEHELTPGWRKLSSVNTLFALKALVTLRARGNHLGDMITIGSFFTKLQHLDLGDNLLTKEIDVSKLTELQTLIVDKNAITSIAGLDKLTGLLELNVAGTTLADLTLPSPAANSTLTRLVVSDSPTLVANLKTILAQVANSLTSLDVSGLKLTTLAEHDIDKLKQLTSLIASRAELLGVLDVSALTPLENLDLSANALTSLPGLNQLTSLTALDLQGNQLAGVDLSANTKLVSLNVGDNPLTGNLDLSSLAALKQLFLAKLSLVKIDVSNNTALEELVLNGTPLIRLDLSKNGALRILKLANVPLPDSGIISFSSLTNLEELELGGQTQLTDLTPFAGNKNLKKVLLPNVIALKNISALVGMSKLNWLDLSGVPLAASSGTLIGQITSLERLVLSDTRYANLSALGTLTALRVLWLDNNQITDAGDLGALVGLKELYLAKNYMTSLAFASKLVNLETLDVSYNQGDDGDPLPSDLSPLSGLGNLTTLLAHRNGVSDLSPLAGLNRLAMLGLKQNKISDAQVLIDLFDPPGQFGVTIELSKNPICDSNAAKNYQVILLNAIGDHLAARCD